jgi:hypothetical protein
MYVRNALVEEAARQMATELAAYDRERLAAAAGNIDGTISWLAAELGHTPTARTVAAASGLDVEDILDLRARSYDWRASRRVVLAPRNPPLIRA